MNRFLGWRKWSIAVLGLVLGFAAALLGKLSGELATLIGTIVSGFYAVNGYTTGKGGEARTKATGSTTEPQ